MIFTLNLSAFKRIRKVSAHTIVKNKLVCANFMKALSGVMEACELRSLALTRKWKLIMSGQS